MSYKRLVKRRDKTYGPYIYESYRDEHGNVRKRYLGKLEDKKNPNLSLFIIVFLTTLFVISASYTTDFFMNNGRFSQSIFNSANDVYSGVVDGITGLVIDGDGDGVSAEDSSSDSGDSSSGSDESIVEDTIPESESVGVEPFAEESITETPVEETVTEQISEEPAEILIEEVSAEEVEEINETVETPINTTEEINETIINETIEEINETVVETNITTANISTLQYKAVIGRPVKWIKTINASDNNISVELPLGAENISILTGEDVVVALKQIDDYQEVVGNANREEIVSGGLITGNVAFDIGYGDGWIVRLWKWLAGFTISGNVILGEELGEKIVETENSVIIEISDFTLGEQEVAVEYYTQAPQANETETENGKRVVVSAPSELNYTEILAYTMVDSLKIKMTDSNLKLYWYPSGEIVSEDVNVGENETEEIMEEESVENSEQIAEEINESILENISEVTNETVVETNESEIAEYNNISEEIVEETPIEDETEIVDGGLLTGAVVSEVEGGYAISELQNEVSGLLNGSIVRNNSVEVSYVPYDFDEDGYVDYIEWVVPHLSAQVYQIVVTDISADVFYFDNVIAQNNFTHLNISDSSPYNSLVLYLPFDTNTSSTTVYDYSGYGNDGDIVVGFAPPEFTTSGKYGGAMKFNADFGNVAVNHSSSLNISQAITVSMWAKSPTNTWNSLNTMFVKDGAFAMGPRSGTRNMTFYVNNATTSVGCGNANYTADITVWNHYAGVYNSTSGNISLYVNGVSVENATLGGVINSSTLPLYMGQRVAQAFNGSLDEVMIFNTSLSASQIADIYNNQSARFKASGTQTLNFRDVPIGSFKYDVNTSFQNLMGSNISTRVGYWNIAKGYNNSDPANGLVGYWHFDENYWNTTSGQVIDIMGLNNGTSVGDANTSLDSDMFGRVGIFDGTGDSIDCGNSSAFNFGSGQDFSVGLWFKTSSVSPIYFVSKGSNVPFWGVSNVGGKLGYELYYDGGFWHAQTSSIYINDSTWHYAFFNFDRDGNATIYLDGNSILVQNISARSTGTLANTGKVFVGSYDGNVGAVYNGSLDEVVVYNRSLSADEVRQLYIKGRANWDYTSYQNLTADGQATIQFDANTTHILPEFKLLAGTNNFYTPILQTKNLASGLQNVTINISNSFPEIVYNSNTDANLAIKDNVFVNVSASDVGYGDGNVSTFVNLDNSLVSWYRFDDNAAEDYVNGGTIIDYMGRNNAVIFDVSGNLSRVLGRMGYGIRFNDWWEAVYINNVSKFNFTTENFTIATWVYTDKILAENAFICKGYNSSYCLNINGTGAFRFQVHDGTGWQNASGGNLTTGVWYHVAGRRAGNEIAVYVNGVKQTNTGTLAGNVSPQNNANLLFAGRPAATLYSNPFNGTLDDVMMWNRSLSDGEIAAIYANSTTRNLALNYTGLANGNHTFKAYAQDSSGFVNDSLSIRTVNIDRSGPNMTYVSPTPYNNYISQNKTNVEVNVTIQDISNVSDVRFNWNGTNYTLYNDSLMLMLNFDNYTRFNDTSKWKSNFTCINQSDCPTFNSSGRFGGAYDFSVLNNRGFSGSNSDGRFNFTNRDFSVSFWFNTKSNSAYQFITNTPTLWGTTNGWTVSSLNNKTTMSYGTGEFWSIAGRLISGNKNINDGVWHFVSAVYDYGGNISLYVDGSLEATAVFSSVPGGVETGYGIFIGGMPVWGVSSDNYSMDEVRIWNRTLSAGEVNQMYMTNLNKYDSDRWLLYVNETKNSTTGLDDGVYTYRVYSTDVFGNSNSTEQRTVTVRVVSSPSGYRFIIKNNANVGVASFDDKGDAYFGGNVNENQVSLVAPGNAFIVQNSSGNTVAYVDSSGNIYLLGNVSRYNDLTSLTSTGLQIRNATNSLVAFFDNLGNLKLKGGYLEGYPSP